MNIELDLTCTLRDYWVGMLEKVLETPSSSTQFSGVKYIADLVHRFPGSAFLGETGYTLDDLGYSGYKSKMGQLKRIYYNEESVKEAQAKIIAREGKEFTSVGINTINAKKDSRSQGHCILGLVVTENAKKGTLRISVMYRMTESVRKFGADLIFFKDVLFPAILGDKINNLGEVVFHFANMSFSPLFFPILLDKVDLPTFFDKTKENPTMRRAVSGVLRRDLGHEAGFHKYRTRNVMHSLAIKAYDSNPQILAAVKEFIEK